MPDPSAPRRQGFGTELVVDRVPYELGEQRPDAVVVDINLGSGPSFKLAEALKSRGVPLLFTTGCDPRVIPLEFDGAERLQKPVQLRQVVTAVSKRLPNAQ